MLIHWWFRGQLNRISSILSRVLRQIKFTILLSLSGIALILIIWLFLLKVELQAPTKKCHVHVKVNSSIWDENEPIIKKAGVIFLDAL